MFLNFVKFKFKIELLLLILFTLFFLHPATSKQKTQNQIQSQTNTELIDKTYDHTHNQKESLSFKLLASLIRQSVIFLEKKKNCDFSNSKSGEIKTVGDWIAWNLSFFHEGQNNSIASSCNVKDNKTSECKLNFHANMKSESPWSCGFQFDIDQKTFHILEDTIVCIGSC